MNTNQIKLSKTRLSRLRTQGYERQHAQELSELAFGIRFAYRFCVTLLIPGVVFAHIPLLSIMLMIAFFGVVLPNHPFDYIYNHLLSRRMKRPQLPPRSRQLKFACMMATPIIATTIYLFINELMIGGYIVGGLLIIVASFVGFLDLCIPSIIYNTLFGKRLNNKQTNV